MVEFKVFKDLESLDNRFCIENFEFHSLFTVLLPVTVQPKTNVLNLSIIFSQPLGLKFDIIRYKILPTGILFQLKNEFRSISKTDPVSCSVILVYQSLGKENLIVFKIDTVNAVYFSKINQLSYFYTYSTCSFGNIIEVSGSVLSSGKIIYFQEEKERTQLNPYILMAFRKFLVAIWRPSQDIPQKYNLAIYRQSRTGDEICIKVFRMSFLYSISGNQMETIVDSNCKNAPIEDLGFYENDYNGYVYIILDMIEPLKMNFQYKFSIWWKNKYGLTQEDFIYFTPFPNINSAKVNPAFVDFQSQSYEALRNTSSSFIQQIFSSHPINPVLEEWIKKTWHDEIAVIPTFSILRSLKFTKIAGEAISVKEYKTISDNFKGIFPFYYLLGIKREIKEVFVELWQVPKKQEISIVENLFLTPNHKTSTFTISWTVRNYDKAMTPGMYVVILTSSSMKPKYFFFRLICKTCNRRYVEIAWSNFNKTEQYKSFLTVEKEIEFEASQSQISFDTHPMEHSVNCHFQVISVTTSSTSFSSFSNSVFIKESVWKRFGSVIVGLIFGGIFIVILFGIIYIYKKRKRSKKYVEKELSIKGCNDSLYDED